MKLHPLTKREKQKQDDNLKIEKNETQQKHALNMYCKEIYTVYIGKLISVKKSLTHQSCLCILTDFLDQHLHVWLFKTFHKQCCLLVVDHLWSVARQSCLTRFINVREYRRAIKKGQSRETGNIWYRRGRKTKQKHNTICVGHQYMQNKHK